MVTQKFSGLVKGRSRLLPGACLDRRAAVMVGVENLFFLIFGYLFHFANIFVR